MLKVLWIEDDIGNIDEYTNNDFDKLFSKPIIPKSFEEAYKYTEDSLSYDFVVIDIDLWRFNDFDSDFSKAIKDEVNFDELENHGEEKSLLK